MRLLPPPPPEVRIKEMSLGHGGARFGSSFGFATSQPWAVFFLFLSHDLGHLLLVHSR